MKKITRTFVRTKETMDKYIKEVGGEVRSDPFMNWQERKLVKEFTHWVIIENDYPYDAIAVVSHILCTKRNVLFDWDLLTDEETDELRHMKKGYLSEHYDLIWENLPKGQTVPIHFHLNLLVLKRDEV